MNEKNDKRDPQGWTFQKDAPSTRSSDGSDSEPTLLEWIVSGFRENIRTVFVLFVLFMTVSSLLLLTTGQSDRPRYDIPGGEIELIEKHQLTEWLQITERLSERLDELDEPLHLRGSLFSLYAALGRRADLQEVVKEICSEESIPFETYRSITHEIALASPLENLNGRNNRDFDDELSTENPDTKRERLRHNLNVLSEQFDRFRRVWNQLSNEDRTP